MKFLTRLRYSLPKTVKDVWYNQSIWVDSAEFPVVFDSKGDYIPCEVGLEVVVNKTKSGKCIYYKVVKLWRTRGSELIRHSDSINCDLEFSRVQ